MQAYLDTIDRVIRGLPQAEIVQFEVGIRKGSLFEDVVEFLKAQYGTYNFGLHRQSQGNHILRMRRDSALDLLSTCRQRLATREDPVFMSFRMVGEQPPRPERLEDSITPPFSIPVEYETIEVIAQGRPAYYVSFDDDGEMCFKPIEEKETVVEKGPVQEEVYGELDGSTTSYCISFKKKGKEKGADKGL